MKKILQEIRQWFLRNETAILSILGMIIIGVLCYTFGWFAGMKMTERPITVYRTTQDPVMIEKTAAIQDAVMRPEDCVYVGSTKGTKYYPPDCSYATKIDPENLRCFRSDDDARDKGYERSTACH